MERLTTFFALRHNNLGFQMKRVILLVVVAAMTMAGSANADLIITGVIDGDLTGGNPKAVVLTATADIADLAIYGIGSANNGGGTDGEEFTLSGSASTGDQIVIAGNSDSVDFFTNCFSGLVILQDGAANINGDDAVELFQNGLVIDTYGVIDVNGDGETWDYTDGYAVRTGGAAGTFDQANYDSQFAVLDGLDEQSQKTALAGAFGFSTSTTDCILGDVDMNGVVEFLDINPFIGILTSNGFQCEADCDEDGMVTFLDIQPFIDILANN